MRTQLLTTADDLVAGRYRIVRPLGYGGGGAVYEAIDLETAGCRVALKLFHRTALGADIEQFILEVLALSRINHRNVLRLIELVNSPPLLGFTMELLEGSTVRELVTSGTPLSPVALASCLRQLCEGLQAIHSLGLVHRDIKPENILLSPGGRCKIADFGLARTKVDLREERVPRGTLEFMSPEQLLGSAGDERSDIYAVGLVGYLLLTGTLPFADEGLERGLIRRTSSHPPGPTEIAPGCCPRLSTIVRRAIELHPDSRPQSAAVLLAELKRAEGMLRVEAGHDIPLTSGPGRRGKTVALTAARSRILHFEADVASAPSAGADEALPSPGSASRAHPTLSAVGEELASLPRGRTRRGHSVRSSLRREIALLVVIMLAVAGGSKLFAALAQPGEKPLSVLPVAMAPDKGERRTARSFGARESKSPVITNRPWWDRF